MEIVGGECRGQQLEHGQRHASGVHLLEDLADGLLRRVPPQLDHRHLVLLESLDDLAVEGVPELNNNHLTGPIPAGLVDRNLRVLFLTGNSGLTGCIPVGLRNIQNEDLDTLGLSDCTTTTTYLLTTTAGTGGRISPLPGALTAISTARA